MLRSIGPIPFFAARIAGGWGDPGSGKIIDHPGQFRNLSVRPILKTIGPITPSLLKFQWKQMSAYWKK